VNVLSHGQEVFRYLRRDRRIGNDELIRSVVRGILLDKWPPRRHGGYDATFVVERPCL
jgi:hypothetical protein